MYGRIGGFLLFCCFLIYLGLDLGFFFFRLDGFYGFAWWGEKVGGGGGEEKVWLLSVEGWMFKSSDDDGW